MYKLIFKKSRIFKMILLLFKYNLLKKYMFLNHLPLGYYMFTHLLLKR